MKNFEVDKILITGEAPVLQSDLGVQPNQIPLNKDLGGLAYMDALQLEDVNVDTLRLREMTAEISDNAADLFVYDTRKDSDGGAWRSRTSDTSWYNEPLNTATRGGRREFPAVAVIVAEADKVTIYDGDDPDLPMWMVFEGTYLGIDIVNILTSDDTHPLSSVFALQGILCIGASALNGFEYINFVDDSAGYYRASISGVYNGGILERNDGKGKTLNSGSFLVDDTVNDVAMTILPNAPIDQNTGLPVPTIAVATDGGVSVIKDDGTVVNSAATTIIEGILFDKKNNLLYYRKDTTSAYFASYYLSASFSYNFFRTFSTVPANFTDSSTKNKAISFGKDNEIIIGSDSEGISRLTSGDGVGQVGDDQLAAYTTSEYNTGWMPGDIKLATLSDTKSGTITDLGQELVINGDFNEDISGWAIVDTANNPLATLTWQTGTAALFRGASGGGRAYQGISTTIGKEYAVKISTNGDSFYVADSTDSSSWTTIANEGSAISDSNLYYFTAITSTTYIILNNSTASSTVIFDGISIKEVSGSVINGDFSNGTTGWTAVRGTISDNNGVLQVSQTTEDNAYAYQDIDSFVVGKKYTISYELRGVDTTNNVFGMVQDLASNTELISREYVSSGLNGPFVKKSHSFVASSDNLRVFFMINTSNDNLSLEVDNISVRRAVEDRSVNSNSLQIFGEIDKTPVAPGADLVAYSGFSANNYLVQPYNEDLDFGTGNFCVMGWFKQSPTTDFHTYLSREGRISVYIDAGTSKLNFRVTDGVNHMNCLSASTVDNDTWTFFVGVKLDGSTYNYINGELNQIADYATVNSLDGEFVTHIGANHVSDARRPADELALWRISATTPTPDQIAKIYRDEKVLFTDGAQATLHGASDAVTALAYDEKMQLLHVGTASGRSDFSGLRRINNTTTAVTTSISAHNNLIAEQ
jgi:hypothetical protein